jgi:hypothetical protein
VRSSLIYPLRKRISGVQQTPPNAPTLREAHNLFTAREFQKAAELYLTFADKEATRNNPQDPKKLLSNCGNCGGPINPKEVDWFDSSKTVCKVIRSG